MRHRPTRGDMTLTGHVDCHQVCGGQSESPGIRCRVSRDQRRHVTDGAGASSGGRFRPLSKSVKVSEPLADPVPTGDN